MWLSLKIQEQLVPALPVPACRPGKGSRGTPLLFVSIPKKTVRLATQRNRLKRLVREAFRIENRLDPGKAYFFRVMQNPGDLGLKEVKKEMSQLIHLPTRLLGKEGKT